MSASFITWAADLQAFEKPPTLLMIISDFEERVKLSLKRKKEKEKNPSVIEHIVAVPVQENVS